MEDKLEGLKDIGNCNDLCNIFELGRNELYSIPITKKIHVKTPGVYAIWLKKDSDAYRTIKDRTDSIELRKIKRNISEIITSPNICIYVGRTKGEGKSDLCVRLNNHSKKGPFFECWKKLFGEEEHLCNNTTVTFAEEKDHLLRFYLENFAISHLFPIFNPYLES